MLDNITKKNIDDCRDVLVGKVPDPKSQIEQITLALIYKFMDDMDKEAVEKFKGKAKFFTGEYAKYGWRKLFDPSLSGQDMLALYSEALEKLNTNPNIPELFRNIFKNAYLPYRDPSTLKLFLKYINEFEYSHSEKLGDAFEYLLSVMGSQGDAGQFRTPRHIIDFVTACVNPQKNETVLDPACGTAGFLLSAYKHILNQNTDKRQGDKLKPDDRKKLAINFVGYDISPDMVRLSLANMYLHGFATPLIHEYDSLSSEDRWQETFDVILANPPFMTPKGGIRPHKKFGVQANKAEVLFTDYIAEHLNSNGRAGIVVPNGIVATSQTAYKQLRKMLVQDSLIAVISLPAGCFNPYSGVKTSILILDKKLAKKSHHILFLKIENDGFDLGAQRREINKNDLPLALQTLEVYKECMSNDKAFEDFPSLATLVEKQLVLENKDINLNAERYFEQEVRHTEFDVVKVSEICNIVRGSSPRPQGDPLYYGGNVPRLMIADVTRDGMYTIPKIDFLTEAGALKSRPMKKGEVIMAVSGNPGLMTILAVDACIHDGFVGFRDLREDVIPQYLYFILNTLKDENNQKADGAVFRNLTTDQIKDFEIPLPPLEIQQQIVAEIQEYQKVIDGAKQVVNNYKPTIIINPDWEMVELGTLAKLVGGSTPSKENSSYWENGNVDWITCSDFSNSPMYIDDSIRKITEKAVKENSTSIVPKDTLVLVTRVSLGKMAFVRKPTALNQDLTALLFDEEKINKRYGYFFMLSIADKIENDGHGATVKGVTRDYVKDIKVPLPSLEEQLTIVKAIEEEMQLVNANKRLIEIFEQKIKTKIGEVWGVKEEVSEL
jgi:type I restriction enzyme M protein